MGCPSSAHPEEQWGRYLGQLGRKRGVVSHPTAEIEGASDRTAALKPPFPLHKMQQPLFPQLLLLLRPHRRIECPRAGEEGEKFLPTIFFSLSEVQLLIV